MDVNDDNETFDSAGLIEIFYEAKDSGHWKAPLDMFMGTDVNCYFVRGICDCAFTECTACIVYAPRQQQRDRERTAPLLEVTSEMKHRCYPNVATSSEL